MSEKEKEATPQAAFTFLEPLVSEQSAKQTVERVSAVRDVINYKCGRNGEKR